MNDQPMLGQLGDPSMTPDQAAQKHAELNAKFGLQAMQEVKPEVKQDGLNLSPFKEQMLQLADESFRLVLEANRATSYVHATYERYLSQARAALVLFAEGDCAWANALEQCFHESNESMRYYLIRWSRDELVADYGGHNSLRIRFSTF